MLSQCEIGYKNWARVRFIAKMRKEVDAEGTHKPHSFLWVRSASFLSLRMACCLENTPKGQPETSGTSESSVTPEDLLILVKNKVQLPVLNTQSQPDARS